MTRAFLNVGYELNEDRLRAHFVQFGSISDLYLPKYGSGRRKGYGFVTFDSAEALDRALLAPAHSVEGIVVQVKRAGPRPPVSELDVPPTPGPAEPFGKGPRLYVGGVADAISEEKVRQHFAKWGSIHDVYFPGTCYKKRGNYCFVTFGDWASAQQACHQSDRVIDGSLVDVITMAGARQQDTTGGFGCSPHSQTGSQAASQSKPLASLQAYDSWLQPFTDHVHASAVPAALLPTPLDQPVDIELLSVPLSRFSLAEQQHVFMQGVHAGMQINRLNAADPHAPSPRPGSTPSSWPKLEPGDETPHWCAKSVFDWSQPGLAPSGLPLPPEHSALSRRIDVNNNAHQALAAAMAQPYDHPLYRLLG
ncbi:hypothetical protein ABBQ32_005652 [Trebouxia sp. C0010 RCD-2024]